MKVHEVLLEATTPTLRQVPGGWAWILPSGEQLGGFKNQADAQNWGKNNQATLQKAAASGAAPGAKPAAGLGSGTFGSKPQEPTFFTKTNTSAAPKGSFPGKYRADVRAGKKNFSSVYVKGRGFVELDDKGKTSPTDKKQIIQKNNLGAKVKQTEQKFIQAFYKSKLVKLLGTKLAIFTPIMAWFEEMAEINVLFDEGFFNNSIDANGNLFQLNNQVAGQHAAEARSRSTQVAMQKIVIELAALAVILKTSPKLVMGLRALLGAIPGVGWISLIGVTAVQGLIIAMLTSDAMQSKIANWIMNDVINITGLADVIGNRAGMTDAATAVGAYINNKKAELTGGN
jgi:hypothetical protein